MAKLPASSCRFCGRETTAKGGVCGNCRPTTYAKRQDEWKDRRSLNRDRAASLELWEMQARAEDDGWAYDDEDEE